VCGSLLAAAQRETAAEQLQPDFEGQAALKRPAGFEVEGLSWHLPAVQPETAAPALRPDFEIQGISKRPASLEVE
jgi:hypothetical protein